MAGKAALPFVDPSTMIFPRLVSVSAGISALTVGTIPIFVALGASAFLSKRIKSHQWVGLLMGLAGGALVVSEKCSFAEATLGGERMKCH